MNEVAKKMLTKSKNSRLESFGKTITFLCMSLIVFVVAMILLFVAEKGLSTFFVNKVNIFSFFSEQHGIHLVRSLALYR